MAEKQGQDGLQPDGSLIFSVILPKAIAEQFLAAMAADERESKSEFARLLIKRELAELADRKAFEEFKRLRANPSASIVPHFPGSPSSIAAQKAAG